MEIMTKSSLKAYRDAKKSVGYSVGRLNLQFAVGLEKLLKQRGCKRKDLAEMLGVSRPYITKILRGDANIDTATMGRIAHALDADIVISWEPKKGLYQAHQGTIQSSRKQKARRLHNVWLFFTNRVLTGALTKGGRRYARSEIVALCFPSPH